MLTKRTNVLLTDNDHYYLSLLASREGKTMGELIRRAIRKTYKIKVDQKPDMWSVWEDIIKVTKKIDTKGLNVKDLINEGRKY